MALRVHSIKGPQPEHDIRPLTEHDWCAFQNLRLHSLRYEKTSFGSTFEREVQFSEEDVISRIQSVPKSRAIFGVFVSHSTSAVPSGVEERVKPSCSRSPRGQSGPCNCLVGFGVFIRSEGVKSSHSGDIYSVYVHPDYQGRGLGKALMTKLMGTIVSEFAPDGVTWVRAGVSGGNTKALLLYESFGFKSYGQEPRAMLIDGEYYSLVGMGRSIDSTGADR